MPRLKSANNASTTLSAAITNAATTMTVADASLFPAAPFRISIDAEIIEVSAINKSTNTFTITRGQEGTTAAAHSAGAAVENRWTAGTHSELADESQVTSVSNSLGAHTGDKNNPHATSAAQVGAYTKAEADGNFAPKNHAHDYLPGSVEVQTDLMVNNDFQVYGNAYLMGVTEISEADLNYLRIYGTPVEVYDFQISKSNKDANGIYTTVEYRSKDRSGRLVQKSVLSGGTSPKYTNRTVSYYGMDGTTVLATKTYYLTYDADGELISQT